jgi:hypothetical protein
MRAVLARALPTISRDTGHTVSEFSGLFPLVAHLSSSYLLGQAKLLSKTAGGVSSSYVLGTGDAAVSVDGAAIPAATTHQDVRLGHSLPPSMQEA